MRSLLLSLSLLGAASAIAGEVSSNAEYSHRINFNLGKFGYEYIAKDAPYASVDFSFMRLFSLSNLSDDDADWYLNTELKGGYNWAVCEKDTLTPYIHGGYSRYEFHRRYFSLRDWYYTGVGLKYMHRFGPVFEMGAHLNGKFTLSKVFYRKAFRSYYSGRFFPAAKKNVKSSRLEGEISIPITWHLGDLRKWEINLEPFFSTIPDTQISKVIGTNITLGYKF